MKSQNSVTVNGRNALNLEIYKMIQYACLNKVGLNVRSTIALLKKENIIYVYHIFLDKGLGIFTFDIGKSLKEYYRFKSFFQTMRIDCLVR